MSRPINPGEGQFMLDGGEYHEPPRVDYARPRNSLSRALTEEYSGLDPNNFMEITHEMVEYVKPEQLRPYLIDVPLNIEKSPYAVSYTDFRTKRERNIAVTPAEAKLLPRFVGALQRNAAIGSASKVIAPFPADTDIARAGRSRIHVQESKLPGMLRYRDSLIADQKLIDKFIVASTGKNVGLSQFGPEGNFRNSLAYLQTFILDPMILAYSAQRKLSESQQRQVGKAIEFSMRLHPEKIGKFHDMMKFLHEYNGHKFQLVDQRIESVQRNIGKPLVPKPQ